jgi:hypothetical protein
MTLCLASTSAQACGTFFGTSVLEAREATLVELWDASFALEAPLLASAPKGLAWTPYTDAKGRSIPPEQQAQALRVHLLGTESAAAWELWMAGDSGVIDKLPSAIRPYAKAARTWKDSGPEGAAGLFLEAAKPRATAESPWPLLSAYMHARMLFDLERWDDAANAFDTVTHRSAAGEADPLSLGARAFSDAAEALLNAGADVEAVSRLVEQATLGVPDAPVSLKWTIEKAMRKDAQVLALVADERTRDALILYALAHFPQPGGDWQLSRHGLPWTILRELDEQSRAALPPPLTLEEAMALIDRGLAGIPEPAIRGADRLAALLYRQGRYDDAARFVLRSDSAVAHWIRAKLAVRAGNITEAREAYGKAAAAFPVDEHWNPAPYGLNVARNPHCRVKAESAILALRSGDYANSLLLFLVSGAVYWHDAAYVAERVVTIEELLSIIRDLERVDVPPLAIDLEPGMRLEDLDANARAGHLVDDPKASLRALTARRLMRAGRYEEAVALFPDPRHRAHATSYRDARATAERTQGVERARAFYEAATLARRRGLAILAFESSPDWAVHGGQVATWGAMEKVLGRTFAEDDWAKWEPGEDAIWITESERERVLMHHRPPEPRFSYRLSAAQLANAAADHLPKDSQAFAAVLCHATLWLLNREPELARVYYRRYLAESKPVPWHATFGKTCPEPRWPST